MMENTLVYFKDDSWNYTAKEVDAKTYSISYITKSGYVTEEDAKAACRADENRFIKAMEKVREQTGMRYTFLSYLDYWYKEILSSTAAPTYKSGYYWVIHNLICPFLEKDVFLKQVTASYIEKILESCKSVCASAGHECYKMLTLVFKSAELEKQIPFNPMEYVNAPECTKKPVVYLTSDEIRAVLLESRRYHSVYLEVLFGLLMGLRSGEVRGLRFSDISFGNKVLTVNQQASRPWLFEGGRRAANTSIRPPKSLDSYRSLRVPDIIMDELEIRRCENEKLLESPSCKTTEWRDYVSIGRSGRIKSDSTYSTALSRICKACGVKRINFHDLRHIYATILIEQGVELERVAKALGHKYTATTFEIYVGVMDSMDNIRSFVEDNIDPVSVIPESGVAV